MQTIDLNKVKEAASLLSDVVSETPLMLNMHLSQLMNAQVHFKREDLQQVRSYKIRGAYNKIASLNRDQLAQGVVCASAGNHAQGVAHSCFLKQVHGVIFMPVPTPKQKVDRVRQFGGKFIEIVLVGDTFDEASEEAMRYSWENNMSFIHPFDDMKVIEGQATIALELLSQADTPIDYVFVPVGGGGVASGISSVLKKLSPQTKIIGVEPAGAASMSTSLHRGVNTRLDHIDKFIDGASVQKVGQLNFEFCSMHLDQMTTVHEGKVCQTILELYNTDAIVVEPAGALSVAVLEQFKDEIAGKNIVCLISGSNNDITRTEEIKERALLYEGVKHYFLVRFPQRAGALKDFISEVLGPHDDITHFEYSKKHNRNSGPAVIGIEMNGEKDVEALIERMKNRNYYGEYLNNKSDLFQMLV